MSIQPEAVQQVGFASERGEAFGANPVNNGVSAMVGWERSPVFSDKTFFQFGDKFES